MSGCFFPDHSVVFVRIQRLEEISKLQYVRLMFAASQMRTEAAEQFWRVLSKSLWTLQETKLCHPHSKF